MIQDSIEGNRQNFIFSFAPWLDSLSNWIAHWNPSNPAYHLILKERNVILIYPVKVQCSICNEITNETKRSESDNGNARFKCEKFPKIEGEFYSFKLRMRYI